MLHITDFRRRNYSRWQGGAEIMKGEYDVSFGYVYNLNKLYLKKIICMRLF